MYYPQFSNRHASYLFAAFVCVWNILLGLKHLCNIGCVCEREGRQGGRLKFVMDHQMTCTVNLHLSPIHGYSEVGSIGSSGT